MVAALLCSLQALGDAVCIMEKKVRGIDKDFVAVFCFVMSIAQRRLSTPARELRRRTVSVTGHQTLRDGRRVELDNERLLAPLEGALSALWVAMVVLAATLVVARI